MTIVRFRLPTQIIDDPQKDGDNPGSFDDAAERLAWISDMELIRQAVNELSARVLDSFAGISTTHTLRVADHLGDARKSIEAACRNVNGRK
jgi:hypothetical protein